MILHLDVDVSGHKSVADLIASGQVVSYPCKSFIDAEGVFWALYRGQIPMPQMIVVDTITALAEKTRQDGVLDPAMKGQSTIWSLGDMAIAAQRDWGIAGDRVVRLLRNIFELDIPSIFIAHEGEREDPMSGTSKAAPNLQKMILSNVVGYADAIVRLRASPLPIAMPDGTTMPAGTRQLLLQPTSDSAVGVRSPIPLPPYLFNPTLADFITTLGGIERMPHNTLIYGPPKIGKTTFACGANRYTTTGV